MKRTAFKKKPSWSYCTADWINEIKIRTSWTNEKLAGELGVSLSTLHNIKSAPWKVSGAYVLRLLEIRNNVIANMKMKEKSCKTCRKLLAVYGIRSGIPVQRL